MKIEERLGRVVYCTVDRLTSHVGTHCNGQVGTVIVSTATFTSDLVPLSCSIYKVMVSIPGVMVYTAIFASLGSEGELMFKHTFEQEALLL